MSNLTVDSNPCVLFINTDDFFTQKATVDLKQAGYRTYLVKQLIDHIGEIDKLQPAMIVMDQNLTGEAGLKFCRQVRNTGSRIPVLMLVEQGNMTERINCLEAGADDYLIKPYHSDQFLSLVNLYLQPQEKNSQQLRFADLVLDLSSRRLLRNSETIDLTMKEFELIKYIMSHPQEVLSREQILENVWGYDFTGDSNVIEVYIRYLRLKIETEGQKRLIHTVRGSGYVLREP